MRLRVVGIAAHGLAKVLDRLVRSALALEGDPQVVVRIRIIAARRAS